MNNSKTLLLIMLLLAFKSYSQKDYAQVNIFRTKAFTIGCKNCVKIFLDDQYVATIDNGGMLDFKIFDTKKRKLTVTDGNLYKDEIILDLKKGQTYNFNIKARVPRSLGFRFDFLDKPITKKIKPDNTIRLTDSGIINPENILPDTDWLEVELKEHWSNNGFDKIEGIYEKVGSSLKYKLAVIKEDNNYKLIYLSGVSGSNWKEGDIKAKLSKTAQFGIFKADWFMLDKSLNNDMIVTFEDAKMTTISENRDGPNVYLKIYPTYDDDFQTSTSNLKGSGSGFFIDKRGYIVTNYHVVKDGSSFEIVVTKKGKPISYMANIISMDKQNDLAVLKINSSNFKELEHLHYNFDTRIQDSGASVFALGYPLTQIMGEEIKFTDGKISSRTGFQGDITNYQISVPIQPGNSGGPLFDTEGNLVGVTSSGINKQIADNANYAIKTNYLKLLIESINEPIKLPMSNFLIDKDLREQVKVLSEYVVLIKVK